MAEADVLASAGRSADASALYRQAAELEAEVFARLPVARERTRGIIAVSAVTLYWRAGALDEAMKRAHEYLGGGALPDFARSQLWDVLLSRWP